MKKVLLILTMLLAFFLYIPAVHAEQPDIDAASYVLLDPLTGQVLCDSHPNDRVYPASTTKIMTAIVALENGKLDQVMTASQDAIDRIGDGGMNIGIMVGEQLTMWDLLNAMLIKSANETANILAENVGSSYDNFIDMMNKKAAELGATNTHYVNACGMHDPNHYTTASDMGKIALYAMKIETFRKIVEKTEYNMAPTNKHDKWDTLYTTNKLHWYNSEYYTKVNGIKTGYTSEAGHNLIASAQNKDGMELVAAVFGVRSTQSSTNVYSLTRKLLEYGFKNFSVQKLVDANQAVKSVTVEGAADNAPLMLAAQKSFECTLPIDSTQRNITTKEYINTSIKAPVNQGDVLGYVEYEQNGKSLGKVNVIASRSVVASTKANIINTAKESAGNPFLKRALLGILIAAAVLLALRFLLQRISRAVRTSK